MAKSTGPKPARFDRCELDAERRPTGSEYGSAPSHESLHPKDASGHMSGNVTDPQTGRPKPVSSS